MLLSSWKTVGLRWPYSGYEHFTASAYQIHQADRLDDQPAFKAAMAGVSRVLLRFLTGVTIAVEVTDSFSSSFAP